MTQRRFQRVSSCPPSGNSVPPNQYPEPIEVSGQVDTLDSHPPVLELVWDENLAIPGLGPLPIQIHMSTVSSVDGIRMVTAIPGLSAASTVPTGDCAATIAGVSDAAAGHLELISRLQVVINSVVCATWTGNVGMLAAALTMVLSGVANQEKLTWADDVAAKNMDPALGSKDSIFHLVRMRLLHPRGMLLILPPKAICSMSRMRKSRMSHSEVLKTSSIRWIYQIG